VLIQPPAMSGQWISGMPAAQQQLHPSPSGPTMTTQWTEAAAKLTPPRPLQLKDLQMTWKIAGKGDQAARYTP